MPNSDVAALVGVAFRRRVKYEKSSVDLASNQPKKCPAVEDVYVWAPSERAMKGRKDQSFSRAGSLPYPTPNQLSISGPLPKRELCLALRYYSMGTGTNLA